MSELSPEELDKIGMIRPIRYCECIKQVFTATPCESCDKLRVSCNSQSDALVQKDKLLALLRWDKKTLVKKDDLLAARIEQLEAALAPMAKAHKSNRPYNEITLHDLRVAFDLLGSIPDQSKDDG